MLGGYFCTESLYCWTSGPLWNNLHFLVFGISCSSIPCLVRWLAGFWRTEVLPWAKMGTVCRSHQLRSWCQYTQLGPTNLLKVREKRGKFNKPMQQICMKCANLLLPAIKHGRICLFFYSSWLDRLFFLKKCAKVQTGIHLAIRASWSFWWPRMLLKSIHISRIPRTLPGDHIWKSPELKVHPPPPNARLTLTCMLYAHRYSISLRTGFAIQEEGSRGQRLLHHHTSLVNFCF